MIEKNPENAAHANWVRNLKKMKVQQPPMIACYTRITNYYEQKMVQSAIS